MSLMVVSGILFIILIISMIYEPRNYWNALVLLMTIGVFLVGFGSVPGIRGQIVGTIMMLIPVVFVAAAVFLIINGFVMIKKEGSHLSNILSMLTGMAMIVGSVATVFAMVRFQDGVFSKMVILLILLLEFYIAFTFVALLIYSLIYTGLPKRIKCDYIIVHGCGLSEGEKVSPLLRGRVDKAVRIYNKCKQPSKLVVSGGRGDDEKVSEAEAMKSYLLEKGFPEKDIIMEEKSRTTFENLKNVRDMLDADGVKHRYIFVTSNYHVFRTSLFAKKLKMKAAGVGCRTAAYYWPSAFIREYIAIMFRYKWAFAAIIVLWGAVAALIN